MANLYTLSESNKLKTWLYLGGFFILIILLGWAISWALDSQIILWFSVALSFLMSFFSYWNSDKIVLSIAGAKEIQKSDNPELYRIIENLCIASGLPLPKVYILNEPQMNAFATGRDPNHGVVAVTTGLLSKLNKTELEGVLAHELSHIGNRDTLISTITVVLVGVVVMVTDYFFRAAFWSRSGDDRDRGGAIMIVLALLFSILAPIMANLMKMAISRKREFLADATGALLTRYPEGLASALEKIATDGSRLSVANDATAHLYIMNPFKGKDRMLWLHRLFSTHPPTEERIKALRDLKV